MLLQRHRDLGFQRQGVSLPSIVVEVGIREIRRVRSAARGLDLPVDEYAGGVDLVTLETPVDAAVTRRVVRGHVDAVVDGSEYAPVRRDVQWRPERRETGTRRWLDSEQLRVRVLHEPAVLRVGTGWRERDAGVRLREFPQFTSVPSLDRFRWRIQRNVRTIRKLSECGEFAVLNRGAYVPVFVARPEDGEGPFVDAVVRLVFRVR